MRTFSNLRCGGLITLFCFLILVHGASIALPQTVHASAYTTAQKKTPTSAQKTMQKKTVKQKAAPAKSVTTPTTPKKLDYSKNTCAFKPISKATQLHFGYVTSAGSRGKTNIIYDGKQIGIGSSLSIAGDHFAFISTTNELVYDGKSLPLVPNIGKPMTVVLWGDNVAYTTDKENIVCNGKVLNPDYQKTHLIGYEPNFSPPEIATDGEHVAFSMKLVYANVDRRGNFASVSEKPVFYDNTYIGSGDKIVIKNGHLMYYNDKNREWQIMSGTKRLAGTGSATVLNGFRDAMVMIDGEHVAFPIGDGSQSGKSAVMYDGKNLGHVQSFALRDGHFVYSQMDQNKTSHIFYDGKEVAVGEYPKIAGTHLAYLIKSTQRERAYELVYDGKNLGELCDFRNFDLSADHILYDKFTMTPDPDRHLLGQKTAYTATCNIIFDTAEIVSTYFDKLHIDTTTGKRMQGNYGKVSHLGLMIMGGQLLYIDFSNATCGNRRALFQGNVLKGCISEYYIGGTHLAGSGTVVNGDTTNNTRASFFDDQKFEYHGDMDSVETNTIQSVDPTSNIVVKLYLAGIWTDNFSY